MALTQNHMSNRNAQSFWISWLMQPLKAAVFSLVAVGFLQMDMCFADIDNSSRENQTSSNAINVGVKFIHSTSTNSFTKIPSHHSSNLGDECNALMGKLNSSGDITSVSQHQNDEVHFYMGNMSLSFVYLSSIIEDNHYCKEKLRTRVTCALKIDLTHFLNTQKQILSGKQIPDGLKKEYLHVKTLSLSNNNIQIVRNNVFDSFIALEVLDLSTNKLTEINLMDAPLYNLTELRASRNKLQHLKSRPFNVSFLCLDYNDLTNVTFLSTFPNLVIVNISNNRISNVPPNIFENLMNLTCIFLENNKISDVSFLPYVSAKIHGVKLSNNKIREINTDLTKHKLRVLELNDNEISSFNFSSFGNTLDILDVCNNNISIHSTLDSPRGHILRPQNRMKILIMCNNSITTSKFIIRLDQLMELDLSNNKLDDVAETLKRMEFRLPFKKLRLKNVNLHSLEFVKKFDKLEELHVDHNKLNKLSRDLFNIESLQELGISNNPLNPLYCADSQLGRELLEYCNISYNTNMNKIVLNFGRSNENVNKDMKCILASKKRKRWNDFFYSCNRSTTLALKLGLSHLPVVAMTLLLTLIF